MTRYAKRTDANHMKRKPAIPTERQEQAALIEWWSHYARSKGLDERLLFAIPNGAVLAGNAQRRAIQMNNLKATGLRVGIPDLMLAVGDRYKRGMFIEMKRKQGGSTSAEQDHIHQRLSWQGYRVCICAGADQAMQAIKDYLA